MGGGVGGGVNLQPPIILNVSAGFVSVNLNSVMCLCVLVCAQMCVCVL